MIDHSVKGSSQQGVIHVIDDERDIVSIITSALQSSGYSVHSFTDASEALQDMEICKKKISMVITDVRMPSHNGFEIARRTKTLSPEARVIFMTAFEINMAEFEKMFPSLQINDFLQKPFHVQQLLEMVRQHDNVGS